MQLFKKKNVVARSLTLGQDTLFGKGGKFTEQNV